VTSQQLQSQQPPTLHASLDSDDRKKSGRGIRNLIGENTQKYQTEWSAFTLPHPPDIFSCFFSEASVTS